MPTPPQHEEADHWPVHPPEVIARAAQPGWLDRHIAKLVYGVLYSVGGLIMYLPILATFTGKPPPLTEVRGSGWHLDFESGLRRCGRSGCGRTIYYIGTGTDGKCYAAPFPPDWDIGMCAARLRQLEANDCAAVPLADGDFCRRWLNDAHRGTVRSVPAIIFYVSDGIAREARWVPL